MKEVKKENKAIVKDIDEWRRVVVEQIKNKYVYKYICYVRARRRMGQRKDATQMFFPEIAVDKRVEQTLSLENR